ncbi:acetyl-CoA carboxylase biotin carboxylase subunit family protein [Streptomyces violaceus]|uniref:ATP-grasp domain-containing protein n=1 Tax=Streptomyces violaceus TaxID=1936 RepID=UPI00381F37CC
MIEDGLESAAAATTALGLPGTGLDTVRVLQDKPAFRELLADRGIEGVAARLGHDEADIRAFVAEFGPTVIKPRYGSGSLGVRLVHGPDAVSEVADWAAEFGLHRFVMEEYLRGPEFSVEAFSFAGEHVVVAYTAKEKLDSFVEVGHVQPADLDADATARIESLVTRMLVAVGIEDGPSHTEVILTPDGPRLVESHNRRGGDRIADLVDEVYGTDIDALAFLWYAGRTGPITPGPARGGGATGAGHLADGSSARRDRRDREAGRELRGRRRRHRAGHPGRTPLGPAARPRTCTPSRRPTTPPPGPSAGPEPSGHARRRPVLAASAQRQRQGPPRGAHAPRRPYRLGPR